MRNVDVFLSVSWRSADVRPGVGDINALLSAEIPVGLSEGIIFPLGLNCISITASQGN